jgi:hypothetical protein
VTVVRTPRDRFVLPVLVAAPAVLAALVGLAHPVFLTPETAERWRLVHLLLLPLFPLVGAAVWLLLLGERGVLAWLSRGLALAYGVLYTGLDSIAGIGAGHQVVRTAERGDPRPPIEDLYDVADPLGQAGVVALAASLLLAAVVVWTRGRSRAAVLGGVVAVACCYPFLRHHVFPPRGVLALAGVGAGLALLAVARSRSARS